MKISLKTLLIIKRIINLNVNVNEKVIISSLSVSNDHLIINFKLNAFKATTFNEIFFEIKMKLNKLSILSLTNIICFFSTLFFEIINNKKKINNLNARYF